MRRHNGIRTGTWRSTPTMDPYPIFGCSGTCQKGAPGKRLRTFLFPHIASRSAAAGGPSANEHFGQHVSNMCSRRPTRQHFLSTVVSSEIVRLGAFSSCRMQVTTIGSVSASLGSQFYSGPKIGQCVGIPELGYCRRSVPPARLDATEPNCWDPSRSSPVKWYWWHLFSPTTELMCIPLLSPSRRRIRKQQAPMRGARHRPSLPLVRLGLRRRLPRPGAGPRPLRPGRGRSPS